MAAAPAAGEAPGADAGGELLQALADLAGPGAPALADAPMEETGPVDEPMPPAEDDGFSVDTVTIENFKSYEGVKVIGPLTRFTAIVGPNGSGKSNLMDALSFVLGIGSRFLRSQKLGDLIFRRDGESPEELKRSARVTLSLKRSPAGQPPERRTFERTIRPDGSSHCESEGEKVTYETYVDRLAALRVLVKARNFCVFQGDVDSIACRQGVQLTKLIEQVSGSDLLKEEYDQRLKEKEDAEAAARLVLGKKRTQVQEKKQVGQQREEMAAYQKLREELRADRERAVLLQLRATHLREKAVAEERDAMGREGDPQAELDAAKNALKDMEKRKASRRVAALKRDDEIKAAKRAADAARPKLAGKAARAAELQRRMSELYDDLTRENTKKTERQQRQQQLEQEQKHVAGELEKVRKRPKKLQLTPEQEAEYERIALEVEQETVQDTTALRQLEARLREAQAAVAKATGEKRELEDRGRTLSTLIEDDDVEASRIQKAQQLTQAQVAEATEKVEVGRARLASAMQEREQLEKRRDELRGQLQLQHAQQRQVEEDRRRRDAVKELQTYVNGVHGRLYELCVPSAKKYRVAITACMGGFADAVVVASSQTGQECIRYLKEHMMAPMLFIPLDDVRVKIMDERLRTLGTYAMQCVRTNKEVERAVQFVLGDTLIVDTLEDARRVAYEDAPRATQGRGQPKLVTLLGERIGKNGNMSYSADAQQDRWEVRDLQMKQRELAEVENKLVEVAALEESGVLQLEADAQALQRKLASYNDRLAVLSRRVESKKEELKGFEEQMKKIEATLAAKQKDVQQFEKEVDERQKKAYAAGKSKFAALGAELQIPDVARAVQDMRRAEEKDRQDEAQLLKRQTQLEAESRFLEQSVSNQSISADTKHVAEMLTVTEKEKLELEAQVRELDKRVEALLKEASEGRNGDLALDEELRTKRAELDTARTRVQKRAQDDSILRSKMKTYEQERTDILRQAQVDEIKVPQKEDGSVAFDGLTREERSMTSATLAGHSDELQRKIALTQMEVDQLRPNFKSQAKFDDIQKKLEVTTKEADDARKKCQNAERDFNDVKQRRKETFLECYNELSRSIDQIYKEMTSYADEEGGTAFLDLDDEEEPYAKGVSLTTMMPRKRFRELHLQSGGERTVAALALLFAMHQYQRPPFMILDEVDAALDQRNVQALVNYLKKADFQAIVISLKDKLYGEADALVGVYKPHRSEASEVLTLDLRPYAANDAPE